MTYKIFENRSGYVSQIQSEEDIFLRPSAILVYDETGKGRGSQFLNPLAVRTSKITLDDFPPDFSVRGTIFLVSGSGEVICPRITDDHDSIGFLRYLESAIGDQIHDSPYFANCSVKDLQITLFPMDRCVIDDLLYWITPDEPFNWGMWIIQVLPALYLAEKHKMAATILCAQEVKWQKDFVNFIAPSRIEYVVKHELNKQYFSTKGVKTLCRSHRNFCLTEFERSLYREICGKHRSVTGPFLGDKIFISRKSQSIKNPHYRVLLNEDVLIDALQRHGFVSVEPESYSFPEQISIFNDAKVIVGLGGAGMFSAVFCEPGTKIFTIESSSMWVDAHVNLFSSSELVYGVLFGTQVGEDEGPHSRWTVDVEEIVRKITILI